MYTKLLVILGLRSACCGANIQTWHHGKYFCNNCESWLGRSTNHTRKMTPLPNAIKLPSLELDNSENSKSTQLIN